MDVTHMQIWVNDKRNVNFPVMIAGINATNVYDTDANMGYMSYTCYTKLRDPPPLRNIHALSVLSAVGHNLCHMGLIYYGIMLGNS